MNKILIIIGIFLLDRISKVYLLNLQSSGVDIDFYRAVQPRFCLWPTPDWLYDNDSGIGKGSGPWATLTVRQWMDELNVEGHFISAYGLDRID